MLYAIVFSLIVTGIITGIHNILIAPLKREKARQQAVEAGHVVKVKYVDLKGRYESNNGSYLKIYEYEVDGKKYRRRFIGSLYDIEDVGNYYEWYYRRYPSKAQNSNDIGRFEYEWIYIFLITFALSLWPCLLLSR